MVAVDRKVVAFYALAAGALTTQSGVGRFRRNMPEPIPVAILARLAVDRAWQGQRFGRAMIRDGALRITNTADQIGIRGIVVHAVSAQARRFCLALGFDSSPVDPLTLMISLDDLREVAR